MEDFLIIILVLWILGFLGCTPYKHSYQVTVEAIGDCDPDGSCSVKYSNGEIGIETRPFYGKRIVAKELKRD